MILSALLAAWHLAYRERTYCPACGRGMGTRARLCLQDWLVSLGADLLCRMAA